MFQALKARKLATLASITVQLDPLILTKILPIRLGNTTPIVRHLDTFQSIVLDPDLDGRRTSIHRILDQLFEC